MTTFESIRKQGKAAQGREELLRHLRGKTITLKQAILAKCYDCLGYYADGKQGCKMPDCPLYPYMPYNENRISFRRISKVQEQNLNAIGFKNASSCSRAHIEPYRKQITEAGV